MKLDNNKKNLKTIGVTWGYACSEKKKVGTRTFWIKFMPLLKECI